LRDNLVVFVLMQGGISRVVRFFLLFLQAFFRPLGNLPSKYSSRLLHSDTFDEFNPNSFRGFGLST